MRLGGRGHSVPGVLEHALEGTEETRASPSEAVCTGACSRIAGRGAGNANGLITADGAAVFAKAELVLTEKEYAFWHDDGMMSQAPAEVKPFFEAARKAVKAYSSRLRKIVQGEIVPGLTALPAPGHTPGHTMVRVGSGNDGLLIWGDIIHTAALQLPHPEWAISFDTDPDQAIATRKAVFDQVASEGVMVAGMHIDFPGIGFISRAKSGYEYHPAFWSPTL